MTRYSKLLSKLFSSTSRIERDLKRVMQFSEKLGHPYRSYPAIHIAGTNGKGSVAFKIAKAFHLSKYRVGLFTSPHLTTYRERIRVDGKMITQREVEKRLEKLFDLARELKFEPKFFELTTLLAFQYFKDQQVDIAIVETGLGGRLDATNIITPILSVITTIDKDHEAILGKSRNAIATEKAGIIKENVPLVLGFRSQLEPILKKAQTLNAPTLLCAEKNDFEEENRMIAQRALEHLSQSFHIDRSNLSTALKQKIPCRMEKYKKKTPYFPETIIFDVAHNITAFEKLFYKIEKKYPSKSIHLLIGFSQNKPIDTYLEFLSQKTPHFHLLPSNHPRLYPHEKLLYALNIMGYERVTSEKTIPKAVIAAIEKAKEEEAILLVTGSFYIMAEVKKGLRLLETFPSPQLQKDRSQEILPVQVR